MGRGPQDGVCPAAAQAVRAGGEVAAGSYTGRVGVTEGDVARGCCVRRRFRGRGTSEGASGREEKRGRTGRYSGLSHDSPLSRPGLLRLSWPSTLLSRVDKRLRQCRYGIAAERGGRGPDWAARWRPAPPTEFPRRAVTRPAASAPARAFSVWSASR